MTSSPKPKLSAQEQRELLELECRLLRLKIQAAQARSAAERSEAEQGGETAAQLLQLAESALPMLPMLPMLPVGLMARKGARRVWLPLAWAMAKMWLQRKR